MPTARRQPEDRPNALVNAQAEDLDRQHVVVPVDDQAGQAIALGVEHPVGVRLGVKAEHVTRKIHGTVDLLLPELGPGGRSSRESILREIWERAFQSPKPSGLPSRSTTFTRSPGLGTPAPTGPITILR